MRSQIFVISGVGDIPDVLAPLQARSGLPVVKVVSDDAYLAHPSSANAICLVVDLPGENGLMALETLRRRGVTVPAILVVDAEIVLPRASLSLSGALDVLEKPVNKRALLGWIECVIAAHIAIAKARAEFRPAA